MKASGCTATEASAVNDTSFVEKKLGLSSFFWTLSGDFAPKTFDVVIMVVAPKMFVVVDVVLKMFVSVVGGAVLKMFVVVIAGAVLKMLIVVVVAGIVLKMFVVVVELSNGEAPNVILEKGVTLVLNIELFD